MSDPNSSNEQLNKKPDAEKQNKSLEDAVNEGLEQKGNGSAWLWVLFALCITPNVINGFHISSYVFFSQEPDDFHCMIPELVNNNWTHEEIRAIAIPEEKRACKFYDLPYDEYSKYSKEEALIQAKKTVSVDGVVLLDCIDKYDSFHYNQTDGYSFIPEWGLVCDRLARRSNVQVALSIGKFFGASAFGIISDKYGRKVAFSAAAVIYILSGLLTTFSPFYIGLLVGRVGLGFCGAGVFYSLFTLITENAGSKYRSSLSIAYNYAYPLGFLYLAGAAYLFPEWRTLSFVLTVPSFLLIIHLIFLVESPRYLISKGQYKKAYQAIYREKPSSDLLINHQNEKEAFSESNPKEEQNNSKKKSGGMLNEVCKIYGPASFRRKALICHFTWCVTSLTYYMLALNAKNFKSNIYIWTALTGTVDIIGYTVSIFVLKWSTRRLSQFTFFVLAGAFLLVVLLIPTDLQIVLLAFAMMSRFCITSVYAIMTLHTAEMFPTEIRNSVLGISSTAAHFGSFFAPYIVDLLGEVAWFIPTTICGSLVVIAGILTLFQPETKNKGLTDHVENKDIELEDVQKTQKD